MLTFHFFSHLPAPHFVSQIHTFLECIALGSVSDLSAFWSLLIAIGSHKAISALALASRFFKEGATLKQVSGWSLGAGHSRVRVDQLLPPWSR